MSRCTSNCLQFKINYKDLFIQISDSIRLYSRYIALSRYRKYTNILKKKTKLQFIVLINISEKKLIFIIYIYYIGQGTWFKEVYTKNTIDNFVNLKMLMHNKFKFL